MSDDYKTPGSTHPLKGSVEGEHVGGMRKQGHARQNLFTDGGDPAQMSSVVFPESTIASADAAIHSWINKSIRGDEDILREFRAVFATSERWVLQKGMPEGILSKDGVPVLPLGVIHRGAILTGTGAKHYPYNGYDRMPLRVNRYVDTDGVQGVEYVDMGPPIPYTIPYTFEVWARDQRQMNALIEQYWGAFRNRMTLETYIADPNTGWTFLIKGETTVQPDNNLEDYTNTRRTIKSSFNIELHGRVVSKRVSRVRAEMLPTNTRISFDVDEDNLGRSKSEVEALAKGSSVMPLTTPDGINLSRSSGEWDDLPGNDFRTWSPIGEVRKIDGGEGGERIYKEIPRREHKKERPAMTIKRAYKRPGRN